MVLRIRVNVSDLCMFHRKFKKISVVTFIRAILDILNCI